MEELEKTALDALIGELIKNQFWPSFVFALYPPSQMFEQWLNSIAAVAIVTDPNEKTGPSGFGAAGYISPNGVLPNRIDFENETNAAAPAQIVRVTDLLSTNLDWSTFQLTEIGFGDRLVAVPAKTAHLETSVPMIYNDVAFEVSINAGIDLGSGEVYAEFYSLDPEIELPPDVMIGFLPPEHGTGRGRGHISYTIKPEAGLTTGTQIRNVADVLFDQGEVVATNQRDPHNPAAGIDPAKECLNTIDAGAPTSVVAELPPTTNSPSFTVSWSGQDDPGGSGVASYDIYASTNATNWWCWLAGTSNTSAVFPGVSGHTYYFFSVARDNVGNVETPPGLAEAQTTMIASLVLSAEQTDARLTIQFPTEVGRQYRVEFRTDLSAGAWAPLPGHENISGTGSPVFVTQPTDAASSTFYRVALLP